MSKSANEKAIEWGCSVSTVRRYCRSGIIPPAEKVGLEWSIPNEWPKPPMTRHGLCFLMDTIYQINHGVKVEAIKWGYSTDDVVSGFNYLIESAFVSTFDTSNLPDALKTSTITPRGEQLIARENDESKGNVSFKAHVNGKINIGIASVETGMEMTKK